MTLRGLRTDINLLNVCCWSKICFIHTYCAPCTIWGTPSSTCEADLHWPAGTLMGLEIDWDTDPLLMRRIWKRDLTFLDVQRNTESHEYKEGCPHLYRVQGSTKSSCALCQKKQNLIVRSKCNSAILSWWPLPSYALCWHWSVSKSTRWQNKRWVSLKFQGLGN